MEENGGPERDGSRSGRESNVSRGARRAHQQGENVICQGCLAEFQHRDIQGRESNREAAEEEDLNGTHIDGQFYREELTPRTHNRPDRL